MIRTDRFRPFPPSILKNTRDNDLWDDTSEKNYGNRRIRVKPTIFGAETQNEKIGYIPNDY